MSAQLILNPFKFAWTACQDGQVSSAESSTGLGAGPEMQIKLCPGPRPLSLKKASHTEMCSPLKAEEAAWREGRAHESFSIP